MKWDNEAVRYPHTEMDEERAEYLALLKEKKRKLQQEQSSLRNLFSITRRRELAVRLSLIQRQMNRREKEDI